VEPVRAVRPVRTVRTLREVREVRTVREVREVREVWCAPDERAGAPGACARQRPKGVHRVPTCHGRGTERTGTRRTSHGAPAPGARRALGARRRNCMSLLAVSRAPTGPKPEA
jgi:hypothetical protein